MKYDCSIIGAVHNREMEVKHLIRSFRCLQKCETVQLVVVDDGSYDNTWEAMHDAAEGDCRIKLIRITPNQKVDHFANMWEIIGQDIPKSSEHFLAELAQNRVDEFYKTGKSFAVNDAHAANVGIAQCDAEIIIKVGGDLYIPFHVNKKACEIYPKYEELRKQNKRFFGLQQYFFPVGGSEHAEHCLHPPANEFTWATINGTFATTKDTYWRTGGYDERILCRSWHADELYNRSGIDVQAYSEFGLKIRKPDFMCRIQYVADLGERNGGKVFTDKIMQTAKDIWTFVEYSEQDIWTESIEIFKEWLNRCRSWKQCVADNPDTFSHIPKQINDIQNWKFLWESPREYLERTGEYFDPSALSCEELGGIKWLMTK